MFSNEGAAGVDDDDDRKVEDGGGWMISSCSEKQFQIFGGRGLN